MLPGEVLSKEKIWWAQAETLPGLFRFWRATRDPALLEKLSRTFSFMTRQATDHEWGGYYWGVSSEGAPGSRGDHKGEIWKTPYHSLRALVLTSDWITSALQ